MTKHKYCLQDIYAEVIHKATIFAECKNKKTIVLMRNASGRRIGYPAFAGNGSP